MRDYVITHLHLKIGIMTSYFMHGIMITRSTVQCTTSGGDVFKVINTVY